MQSSVVLKLLLIFAVNAVALWVTVGLLPGLTVAGGVAEWIGVGLVFALVNTLIKPVVKLLTIPIHIVTLGLFTFVVNGAMVLLTGWVVDVFEIEGGLGTRLLRAMGAAIVISLVSSVIALLVEIKPGRPQR